MKNDEQNKKIFISFVDEVIQNLRTNERLGVNKVLKSIDGAEDISEINVKGHDSGTFHMSQFEVGYFYILNSTGDWINILMPLDIDENHSICSYFRQTIIKSPHPQEKSGFWGAELQNESNVKITSGCYWSPLQLCLKIPNSLFFSNRFLNWNDSEPWEVKE
jgi:hypothetical protein